MTCKSAPPIPPSPQHTPHRSEYDRGVNTFSPEGRLYQVEYAMEAIKLGSTTVGITTPHGVVLAVEKRIQSTLLESSSIEKIMEIDSHVGCAMSGLTADARTMVEHGEYPEAKRRESKARAEAEAKFQLACLLLVIRIGKGMDVEMFDNVWAFSFIIFTHVDYPPHHLSTYFYLCRGFFPCWGRTYAKAPSFHFFHISSFAGKECTLNAKY